MPSIKWTDNTPEGKKREELIKKILPKKSIMSPEIHDRLLNVMKDELIILLKKEIEVYKAFPKKGKYNPDAFNPRNSRQCFMGQGFTANGHGFEGWTDYDLVRYRDAVGKIPHAEWGDVTLLEIWGGDHFADYKEMVKGVFMYAWGEQKELPKIEFHVNPFYKNLRSGKWDPDPDEILQGENRDHLIKIAHYSEIKQRMKKAGVDNAFNLGLTEADDPKPSKRSSSKRGYTKDDIDRYIDDTRNASYDEDEEEDEDEY